MPRTHREQKNKEYHCSDEEDQGGRRWDSVPIALFWLGHDVVGGFEAPTGQMRYQCHNNR